jgi:hypothetical protein
MQSIWGLSRVRRESPKANAVASSIMTQKPPKFRSAAIQPELDDNVLHCLHHQISSSQKSQGPKPTPHGIKLERFEGSSRFTEG